MAIQHSRQAHGGSLSLANKRPSELGTGGKSRSHLNQDLSRASGAGFALGEA